MSQMAGISRQRHVRLVWYATVSFVLTLIGRYLLGFDQMHSIVYAATAYLLLIVLNYKTVLTKTETTPRRSRRRLP